MKVLILATAALLITISLGNQTRSDNAILLRPPTLPDSGAANTYRWRMSVLEAKRFAKQIGATDIDATLDFRRQWQYLERRPMLWFGETISDMQPIFGPRSRSFDFSCTLLITLKKEPQTSKTP